MAKSEQNPVGKKPKATSGGKVPPKKPPTKPTGAIPPSGDKPEKSPFGNSDNSTPPFPPGNQQNDPLNPLMAMPAPTNPGDPNSGLLKIYTKG